MPQGHKTTLRIIDCKPVYHGKNGKGDEYTIHEIKAAREDGTLVNEKLRSFTSLPIGQVVAVTVVPYVSEQYGKSFTLYPENKGTSTTAQQNSLQEQVTEMAATLATLAQRVTALERWQAEAARGVPPPGSPAPLAGDPGQAALDAAFGADPPFD